MANQVDVGRSWGRTRSLAGIPVALSLVVVGLAEGSHAHDDEGGDEGGHAPAACLICELPHNMGPVASSATPSVGELSLVQGPALRWRRLNVRAVHLSPHRSRAPPLPISL
ncbi:MAG: DUF2946 domain-containing protein [Gemmatimonadales bacterium]|nr:DUF2946 domain-containing protein [Gemmatimonadales bacterium]MYG47847.1 DUF2946 domain-containing protein [Gemmatimonadales bacterium]MYK02530.1 DUF2946 domain-containing protein [Candidatus Palauibacter ramosifaciens]